MKTPVSIWKVLRYVYLHRTATPKEVAYSSQLGLSHSAAWNRLERLRQWGYVTTDKPTGKQKRYSLTQHGLRKLNMLENSRRKGK